MSSMLEGLTRPGRNVAPFKNPGKHAPLGMQNRILMERLSPDPRGLEHPPVVTQRVVKQGNIMCTVGLDALVNLMSTSALAFTATNGWCQAGAVGTGATAVASTQVALVNSTASVHISAASMNISDKGARTLEYQMTFDDANPYTIIEVGLFASNGVTGSMIARSVLVASDQVIKGTADTVNVSHQILFSTGSE